MRHTRGVSVESEYRNLISLAQEAQEQEVHRFAASRGPWYGFNGVYVFLVTAQSLWRSRSGLRSVVGGEPSVERWALDACTALQTGERGIELSTPEGSFTMRLASAAETRAVSALLSTRPLR